MTGDAPTPAGFAALTGYTPLDSERPVESGMERGAGAEHPKPGGESRKSFCADDARVACPLFQAEYGGSTPTSALQLRVVKIRRKLFAELNRRWHSRLPECGNCWNGITYGAESGNAFFAVAWWSHPVNNHLTDGETWELRRMAVAEDAPPNTASRFLMVMVRLLRKERPELKRLVSYQDTAVHAGTIYKASGWTPVKSTNTTPWAASKRGRAKGVSDGTLKVRWELILSAGGGAGGVTADGTPRKGYNDQAHA
jgi:hypothetical protein